MDARGDTARAGTTLLRRLPGPRAGAHRPTTPHRPASHAGALRLRHRAAACAPAWRAARGRRRAVPRRDCFPTCICRWRRLAGPLMNWGNASYLDELLARRHPAPVRHGRALRSTGPRCPSWRPPLRCWAHQWSPGPAGAGRSSRLIVLLRRRRALALSRALVAVAADLAGDHPDRRLPYQHLRRLRQRRQPSPGLGLLHPVVSRCSPLLMGLGPLVAGDVGAERGRRADTAGEASAARRSRQGERSSTANRRRPLRPPSATRPHHRRRRGRSRRCRSALAVVPGARRDHASLPFRRRLHPQRVPRRGARIRWSWSTATSSAFRWSYAQDVEGLRPDVVVLDQELLRRSWYLQDLERPAPRSHRRLAKPGHRIPGRRSKPFEAGQAYDGATLDNAYYAMIKSLVDRLRSGGPRSQHLRLPARPARRVQGFSGKSVVALLKARRSAPAKGQAATAAWLTPLDPGLLDFAHLTDGTVPLDRNVLMIRDWYGRLLAARARLARPGRPRRPRPREAQRARPAVRPAGDSSRGSSSAGGSGLSAPST